MSFSSGKAFIPGNAALPVQFLPSPPRPLALWKSAEEWALPLGSTRKEGDRAVTCISLFSSACLFFLYFPHLFRCSLIYTWLSQLDNTQQLSISSACLAALLAQFSWCLLCKYLMHGPRPRAEPCELEPQLPARGDTHLCFFSVLCSCVDSFFFCLNQMCYQSGLFWDNSWFGVVFKDIVTSFILF